MDRLFELMSVVEPLSDQFKQALTNRMVLLSLPKNYLLLEPANVSDHAYFLNSGIAMSFRYQDGKKHIEEFYVGGRIIVSPRSFFEQTPSKEAIQLIEQSDVLHISYSDVMQLLKIFPEASAIYRATMNLYYEESRDRIYDFKRLNAVERYEKLLRNIPHIEQLVPQEYIASYLGIAPQSLSRIRRETE